MKKTTLYFFSILCLIHFISCGGDEISDVDTTSPPASKPIKVDSLTIEVKDKQGLPIKDVSIVVFEAVGAFDKRIGEAITDDAGKYKLWRHGLFEGYCTVVAQNYEPKIIEFSGEPINNTVKTVVLEDKSTWSILCYNILQAFQGDVAADKASGMTDAQIASRTKSRRASFAKWVKIYDPDVIFFQELNGLKGAGAMEAFVKEFGYDYGTVVGASNYPMGVATKTLHTQVQKYGYNVQFNGKNYALHHGAGHVLWENIRLFAVHFCPFWEAADPAKRCHVGPEEAELVMSVIKSRTEIDWIVAGDFNSSSEFDKQTNTPLWYYRNKNMGVTNLFDENGFKDAFRYYSRPDRSVRRYKATAGISSVVKNMQERSNRIDYVVLSPSLANRCTYADVIQTQFTDTVSDHYPVYIRLKKQ